MQQFTRGSFVFDVNDSGPSDGDVVVLLHGYPETRASWDKVTPMLTDAGLRVLAPDQRGYSPGARPRRRRDYRIGELAADIVALIDASGASKAHVVGHDWGGAVAWALATRHPDRVKTVTSLCTPHGAALLKSFVTSNQLLHSWYMLFFQLPMLPELGWRPSGEKTLRRTLRRSGAGDDAIDRFIAKMREPGAARGAINWYRALPLSGRVDAKVTVPTLYVYPTGDMFLGRKAADLTADYVSAPYRFEVIDGESHWLPDNAPDLVAKLVLEHIGAH
jgi:pimeloyl-ACP methyl ester carboxylesterase